jgi:hypothetical protein
MSTLVVTIRTAGWLRRVSAVCAIRSSHLLPLKMKHDPRVLREGYLLDVAAYALKKSGYLKMDFGEVF